MVENAGSDSGDTHAVDRDYLVALEVFAFGEREGIDTDRDDAIERLEWDGPVLLRLDDER